MLSLTDEEKAKRLDIARLHPKIPLDLVQEALEGNEIVFKMLQISVRLAAQLHEAYMQEVARRIFDFPPAAGGILNRFAFDGKTPSHDLLGFAADCKAIADTLNRVLYGDNDDDDFAEV